jgi:vacuolar-type H+-ATPase subunit H
MTREQAVREAQEIVRKAIKPGRSLVDDLLRERRAEVAREAKVVRGAPKVGRRSRTR